MITASVLKQLSGHNSKKQPHIFFLLIDFRSSHTFIKKTLTCFEKQPHTKKISAAHFLSETVVHWYLSEAAARSLKNIKIHLIAATHLLKHKKYVQKQLHKFFQGFYTEYTHFFHNFSMIMKNIFDGY